MMLSYNGRACILPFGHKGSTDQECLTVIRNIYILILREFEGIWEEKGSLSDFYDNYYLLKAIELTKDYLSERQACYSV